MTHLRISSPRSFPVLLSLLSVSAAAQVFNVTWRTDVNGGFGNWNDAAQWDPAVVPNKTGSDVYNVTIGGTVGTTLQTPVVIDRLNFNGGQILEATPVNLDIIQALTMNLSGPSQLTVETVNLVPGSASVWFGGDLTVNNIATIRNYGSFTVANATPAVLLVAGGSRPTPAFVNEANGTFTMGSSSDLHLQAPLENAGLFVHPQGLINYDGGLRQPAGEYRLGLNATARGDLQFTGGTIRAEGTFDPDTVMQVTSATFLIGPDSGTPGNVNFNNKALSLLGGTFEFKIESASAFDRISNLATWSATGTQLLLRLINGAENTLQPSDTLILVNATSDTGVIFGNVANGGRLTTADGLGSFLVSYPAGSGDLILSDFQPVPEPQTIAISAGLILFAFGLGRRFKASGARPCN